jgi:hypothetical protein
MDDNWRSTIEPIPEDDEIIYTTELGQILLPSSSASQQITERYRLHWSVDGEALVSSCMVTGMSEDSHYDQFLAQFVDEHVEELRS